MNSDEYKEFLEIEEKALLEIMNNFDDEIVKRNNMEERFIGLGVKKEEILQYKKEEIRIVIAGDLVHQKIVISNEQLMLGTWFLRKLEEIAPVIMIAGNHDTYFKNTNDVNSPELLLAEYTNIRLISKAADIEIHEVRMKTIQIIKILLNGFFILFLIMLPRLV